MKKTKASGSYYERVAKKMLEKEGWLVLKSGGSFTYDLVAIRPDKELFLCELPGAECEYRNCFPARLIEVKSRKSESKVKSLLRNWEGAGELWVYLKGMGGRKGKWFFK